MSFTGHISEQELLRLNGELDFECSIIVVDKARVFITGTKKRTNYRVADVLREAPEVSITAKFHSHPMSDSPPNPSAGDFANYSYHAGLHAVATGGKILSYELPEMYRGSDMRDVLLVNVDRELRKLGEVIGALDLMTNDYDRFVELFISSLPAGSVRHRPQEVVDALNPI